MLALRLLGPPQILVDGELLAYPLAKKAQALLFQLAVTDETQTRTEVAALLWPEMTDQLARKNLRTVLPELHKAIGACLSITHQTIAFSRANRYQLDVETFRRLCTSDPASDQFAALRQAVALYRGEFLKGFYIHNAPDFEDWVRFQREQLQTLAVRSLTLLADQAIQTADARLGLEMTQKLLLIEPWLESAHRQQMTLLALDDQRGAALAQYESCRQILAREFHMTPSAETVSLSEQIRAGKIAAPTRSLTPVTISNRPTAPAMARASLDAPASHIQSLTIGRAELVANPTHPLHNLPRMLTPLLGRRAELGQLCTLLQEEEWSLITVVGEGGVGKTRLVVEAARRVQSHFADGVWLVTLDDDPPASAHTLVAPAPPTQWDRLVAAVAKAVKFSLQGAGDLMEQLCAYLRLKRVLLILDNFETVLAEASFVLELLRSTEHTKILVTSRRPLQLLAEQRFTLAALPLPTPAEAATMTDAELLEFGVIALFVQRGQAAQPSFSFTATNRAEVIEICRFVGGLPLGIELAAAQLRRLSCMQLLAALQQDYDVLAASVADLPERHRSIQAVLTASWQLLTVMEARVLAICSVFQDSFTLAAATMVAETEAAIVYALVESCLLRQSDEGRLKMYVLSRQFAARRLAAQPAMEHHAWARHSAYVTGLLEVKTPFLGDAELVASTLPAEV